MARWEWQGGDWRYAGGRERLKERARLLGWRRLVQGGAVEGKDGEVEIVKWRWQGGRRVASSRKCEDL